MPRLAVRVMKGVIAALERLGDLSGLRLNFDKTRCLLRGFWPDPVRQQMAELGCKADPSARYLGIQPGTVSPEEAFAPVLAKALARARSVTHFSVDASERAQLLQTWILPIFAFPAKAYFPTPSVCSYLRAVYLAALRQNSWSLTLPFLERTKQQGGMSLPQPRTYLLWQHASAFVSHMRSPERFRGAAGDCFKRWGSDHGVVVTAEDLPWFQLVVVPLANIPFLASSARAFSVLRQGFSAALPPTCDSRTWPAWHTVSYGDEPGQAYFFPSLVRKGVTMLAHLRSRDSFPRCLPPAWLPRYRCPLAPSAFAGELGQELVQG